jgi:phosphopantetheinyl transferase
MPLVEIIAPPLPYQLAVWKIDESLEYLLNYRALAAIEQEEYNGLRNDIRRRQWLAARLAAAQLIDSPIIKSEHGAPVVLESTYSLSLSHSYGYAAAACAKDKKVALDIEWLYQRRNPEMFRMFMNRKEIDFFLAHGMPMDYFFAVWCIKETLFKLLNWQYKDISFRHELETALPEILPVDQWYDCKGFFHRRQHKTRSFNLLAYRSIDWLLVLGES